MFELYATLACEGMQKYYPAIEYYTTLISINRQLVRMYLSYATS